MGSGRDRVCYGVEILDAEGELLGDFYIRLVCTGFSVCVGGRETHSIPVRKDGQYINGIDVRRAFLRCTSL